MREDKKTYDGLYLLFCSKLYHKTQILRTTKIVCGSKLILYV